MKEIKLFGIPTLILVLLVLLVSIVSAAPPDSKQSPVGPFPSPSGVAPGPGAIATLTRYSDKVHINVNTNNLDEGAAYTLWAANWDDPSKCEGACDGPDLCTVEGSSLYFVTGHVINSNGTAIFDGMIKEGPASGDVACTGPNTVAGLGDAEVAELHFAVRTHGLPIPGLVPDQIKTLRGGCSINSCSNQQGTIFQP